MLHVCKSRRAPCGAEEVRGRMRKTGSGYNRWMLLQGNESARNVDRSETDHPSDQMTKHRRINRKHETKEPKGEKKHLNKSTRDDEDEHWTGGSVGGGEESMAPRGRVL
jgi:hypothetical protein